MFVSVLDKFKISASVVTDLCWDVVVLDRPDVFTFSDGSIVVSINDMAKLLGVDKVNNFSISAYLENMDDLMVAAQLKDILKRCFPHKDVVLYMYGTLYSRYDRVMFDNGSDSFGLKVFSDFINSIGFDQVVITDPHSDVYESLLGDNHVIRQEDCLWLTVDSLFGYNIVNPDFGASKKVKGDLVFDKVRCLKTGRVQSSEIKEDKSNPNLPFLVVDDICDGGRTFVEALSNIKTKYPDAEVDLYITHGIFAKGLSVLDGYRKIYVYSMQKSVYDSFTQEQKDKLKVYMLFDC